MEQEGKQLDEAILLPVKHPIQQRPLICEQCAVELEAVFKVLGNRTRLRMIHALIRVGEMCVTELAVALSMKPQAISNQLQRLADRGILASKRNGNNIYYRVVDPLVVNLLDRGLYLKEV
ncbi:MAG: ArsR/SmtB family transcription factor [Syntrophobacteria bacterium]